ncbi:hypothetical protein ZWY2020_042321 [Hordeum vulgare]|nr:hypothetical protein ZWY2020_042321 [Hordeum vulgare]
MMHFALRGTAAAGRRKAAHARSASHPCHCQCHPVHARLDAGVRALRAWPSASAADGPSGLARVEAVLAVLGEFLALPQAAAALRDDATACDRFLTLADAYGSFEQALLALKQSVAQLRAGGRLGDGTMVAASLRARGRAEKELCGLAVAMRHASRHAVLAPADAADGEVARVVAEAAAATASASEAIFLWCAAMPPDVSSVVQTVPSSAWLARLRVVPAAKKAVSLPETAAALERLEERIGELESGSEKVFSSLLQARVSLLNIHNTLYL